MHYNASANTATQREGQTKREIERESEREAEKETLTMRGKDPFQCLGEHEEEEREKERKRERKRTKDSDPSLTQYSTVHAQSYSLMLIYLDKGNHTVWE